MLDNSPFLKDAEICRIVQDHTLFFQPVFDAVLTFCAQKDPDPNNDHEDPLLLVVPDLSNPVALNGGAVLSEHTSINPFKCYDRILLSVVFLQLQLLMVELSSATHDAESQLVASSVDLVHRLIGEITSHLSPPQLRASAWEIDYAVLTWHERYSVIKYGQGPFGPLRFPMGYERTEIRTYKYAVDELVGRFKRGELSGIPRHPRIERCRAIQNQGLDLIVFYMPNGRYRHPALKEIPETSDFRHLPIYDRNWTNYYESEKFWLEQTGVNDSNFDSAGKVGGSLPSPPSSQHVSGGNAPRGITNYSQGRAPLPPTAPSPATRTNSKSTTSDKEDAGKLYEKGHFPEAARLFRIAADRGDADAQFNIALMLKKGEGVPQNYAEALRYFNRAAAQGLDKAQNSLGVIYRDGIPGVPRDLKEAERYFKLANYAEALRYYRLAAAQGLDKAQNSLGLVYRDGLPGEVSPDRTEAERYFKLAADQGNTKAMENYMILMNEV
eukprot:gene24246-29318_t